MKSMGAVKLAAFLVLTLGSTGFRFAGRKFLFFLPFSSFLSFLALPCFGTLVTCLSEVYPWCTFGVFEIEIEY